jgi:hypothetical protein
MTKSQCSTAPRPQLPSLQNQATILPSEGGRDRGSSEGEANLLNEVTASRLNAEGGGKQAGAARKEDITITKNRRRHCPSPTLEIWKECICVLSSRCTKLDHDSYLSVISLVISSGLLTSVLCCTVRDKYPSLPQHVNDT